MTCPAGATTPCTFMDMGTFLTPAGFNLVSATITTTLTGTNAATDINFGSVLLNGVAFTMSPNGAFEFGSLLNQPLAPGALNTLTVNGTTGGNASYAGTLSFAAVPAVPEPATWAMMLFGFGAIGVGLRRRTAAGRRFNFNFA